MVYLWFQVSDISERVTFRGWCFPTSGRFIHFQATRQKALIFQGDIGTADLGRIVEEIKTCSARTFYNANWQHIKLHHTIKKCCCEALLST
jgi:hypothetical protein